MVTRRQFNLGLTALAFAGLTGCALGNNPHARTAHISRGYGMLIPDPDKLLDLPKGFRYQVISQLSQTMSDGFHVPDRADGMGCLPLDDNHVALIRNHELKPSHLDLQPESIRSHQSADAYDTLSDGTALPGGTSTIIFNLKTQQVEQEFLSLVGTIRNCAGGITPWNTWLTCEESLDRANGMISKDHGYVFEVPADAKSIVKATPLKAMGRFNHEAAAVDPKTGIVYLTEDRDDSLFYRFIPNTFGKLIDGGQLQALVIRNKPQFDSRNWTSITMPLFSWFDTEWINITNPESPNDDLRLQGYSKGAARFARGEGIHWADNELYFCCTSGGNKQLGQIMRYQPTQSGGRIQLFLESQDKTLYNFGDNLTVTPNGHLFVCEDQYTSIVDNHIRGVTPEGKLYNFARLHEQTELAGACFSPDGSTLFVNVYSPTKTLAITGPWQDFMNV